MLKRIIERLFRLEPEVCFNCEFLKTILEQERREKDRLLQLLLQKNEPVEIPRPNTNAPISSGRIPWPVMQQQLERADALKAANDRKNKTAELEAELEVNA